MSIFGSDDTKDNYKAAPTPERLRKNERVLIITADNTEDLEFFYPYYRLNEEGYQVDVATIDGDSFKAKHGYEFKDVKSIKDVRASDYELLYIPGGKAPAELRKDADVLNFVREFANSGKFIAAICHGAQVLVSAKLVSGKRIAAWPEVRKEIEEAGGTFVDEALVEDGQFITARKPGDLPRHLFGVLDCLKNKSATRASSRPAAA